MIASTVRPRETAQKKANKNPAAINDLTSRSHFTPREYVRTTGQQSRRLRQYAGMSLEGSADAGRTGQNLRFVLDEL